ncbi:unnamed protein product, partial [Mycena citricolor]
EKLPHFLSPNAAAHPMSFTPCHGQVICDAHVTSLCNLSSSLSYFPHHHCTSCLTYAGCLLSLSPSRFSSQRSKIPTLLSSLTNGIYTLPPPRAQTVSSQRLQNIYAYLVSSARLLDKQCRTTFRTYLSK